MNYNIKTYNSSLRYKYENLDLLQKCYLKNSYLLPKLKTITLKILLNDLIKSSHIGTQLIDLNFKLTSFFIFYLLFHTVPLVKNAANEFHKKKKINDNEQFIFSYKISSKKSLNAFLFSITFENRVLFNIKDNITTTKKNITFSGKNDVSYIKDMCFLFGSTFLLTPLRDVTFELFFTFDISNFKNINNYIFYKNLNYLWA